MRSSACAQCSLESPVLYCRMALARTAAGHLFQSPARREFSTRAYDLIFTSTCRMALARTAAGQLLRSPHCPRHYLLAPAFLPNRCRDCDRPHPTVVGFLPPMSRTRAHTWQTVSMPLLHTAPKPSCSPCPSSLATAYGWNENRKPCSRGLVTALHPRSEQGALQPLAAC